MSARATSDEAVFDVPERARYELRLDGKPAGICEYERRPGRLALLHVEVDPAFGGHGVGSRLVRAILDDLRSRGERLDAECPFVIDFLTRHPEDSDLVFVAPGRSSEEPDRT